MLNPFTVLKIYGQLNKVANKAKEMTMQNWKTTLFGVLAAGLLAVGNYAGPNNWQGYAAAAAVAILGALAKDFDVKLTPDEIGAVTKAIQNLKLLILFVGIGFVLLYGTAAVHAQDATLPSAPTPAIQNLYAAGASYAVNSSPGVAGTALYAHLLSDGTGTYAFTVVDALPETVKPFTVTTNVGIGVAQRVATVGKVTFWVPTSAGVSWSGANVGWQWNGGGAATIPLKNGTYLVPTVRFLKSSVSGGSGYQPIVGLLFGWGK